MGDLRERAYCASFSPDERLVAASCAEGFALTWAILPSVNELIERAKLTIPRTLTMEQREQFFLTMESPTWCIEMEK